MEQFINALEWRYATKKYDAAKKLSDNDLKFLKKVVQLSTSSMGLQPYKIFIIENQELKDKLAAAAIGNNAISFKDASHIFIFANTVNYSQENARKHIENMAAVNGQNIEELAPFEDKILAYTNSLAPEVRNAWTAKQAYIAMGNLINAAALIKIDATPMEGFDAAKINQILDLDAQGLSAAVIATVGYRHADDTTQHNKKVRKQNEDLFVTL